MVEESLRGGANVLQLRDKSASDDDMVRLAKSLLPITRRHAVPLLINDRLSVVIRSGADGLHWGQEDGSYREARQRLGETALMGRSTHTPEQAMSAEKEGFDYVGVGPVFATPTKPDRAAVGLEFVRYAAQNLTIPFVAIGGIDETNIGQVVAAGAKTVAVVRALLGSQDPKASARRLCELMQKASS